MAQETDRPYQTWKSLERDVPLYQPIRRRGESKPARGKSKEDQSIRQLKVQVASVAYLKGNGEEKGQAMGHCAVLIDLTFELHKGVLSHARLPFRLELLPLPGQRNRDNAFIDVQVFYPEGEEVVPFRLHDYSKTIGWMPDISLGVGAIGEVGFSGVGTKEQRLGVGRGQFQRVGAKSLDDSGGLSLVWSFNNQKVDWYPSKHQLLILVDNVNSTSRPPNPPNFGFKIILDKEHKVECQSRSLTGWLVERFSTKHEWFFPITGNYYPQIVCDLLQKMEDSNRIIRVRLLAFRIKLLLMRGHDNLWRCGVKTRWRGMSEETDGDGTNTL